MSYILTIYFNKINWETRALNAVYKDLFVTVDGTDCRIVEPWPFSPDWYSHKFHGAGLRYEIAVSISTGYIVWATGPYPCGLFPDLKIFNSRLQKKLLANEVVLCDKGYRGRNCKNYIPEDPSSHMSAVLLARHETVNRRLKIFNVLGQKFRHRPDLHSFCFHAVLNLTQLMLEDSNPLFDIKW